MHTIRVCNEQQLDTRLRLSPSLTQPLLMSLCPTHLKTSIKRPVARAITSMTIQKGLIQAKFVAYVEK